MRCLWCKSKYSNHLRFRSNSAVQPPRGRFLADSSGGSRSSASAPPVPRPRTLGPRADAERVDRELSGPWGSSPVLLAAKDYICGAVAAEGAVRGSVVPSQR